MYIATFTTIYIYAECNFLMPVCVWSLLPISTSTDLVSRNRTIEVKSICIVVTAYMYSRNSTRCSRNSIHVLS